MDRRRKPSSTTVLLRKRDYNNNYKHERVREKNAENSKYLLHEIPYKLMQNNLFNKKVTLVNNGIQNGIKD